MKVSFQEAVIQGLAPDKGYIFPENITPIENVFYDKIENLSNEEIAFEGDFKSKASNSFTN